ncbi:MAG: hypothetical protein ACOX6V_02555 [Patescibacteria group bacterium]|jgi:hypothetical protein
MGSIKYGIYLVLFCLLGLFLTACSPKIDFSQFQLSSKGPENPVENSPISIDDILQGNSLVAFANNNSLYLVDPEFARPLAIYAFKSEEQPPAPEIESFIISPTKQWVVWYTPIKGVMALSIKSQEIYSIYPPNSFLNTNPYLDFSPNSNVVMFITDEGNTLYHHNLANGTVIQAPIPYPYGNVFKLSPNGSMILFVSGYGQTTDKPKFMFTTKGGRSSHQFSTKTNLADRNYVFWAPDSTGVVTINNSTLELYTVINPENPETIVSLNEDNAILSVKCINDKIFVLSKKGYWHVFDYYQRKEVARTPITIASELNKPRSIPWSENQFLIEEIVPDGPAQFKRLWLSDFKGNKKIVVEKYNEVIIQTETPVIN